MHCESKYFSLIYWDLFFSVMEDADRETNKAEMSEISHFMSHFGRGSVGGRQRPHVSFRYPDLEKSFRQMALETLGL